jgi:hypothetical protein
VKYLATLNNLSPQEGDMRAARGFGDRVRADIAKILDVALTCIQVSGVHRGSLLVDFNIYQPDNSPRTPRQLFAALSAQVADPSSPLHTQVCTHGVAVAAICMCTERDHVCTCNPKLSV